MAAKPLSDETLARLHQMVSEEYSLSEICKTLKIGYRRVYALTGYRGIDLKVAASLGAKARIASLKVGRF